MPQPVTRPILCLAPEPLTEGYEQIIGYAVMGKATKKLDWDGELHPLRVDALESLTGLRQTWCQSLEDETEEPLRTYWGKSYDICPVYAPEATPAESVTLTGPSGIHTAQVPVQQVPRS